jgi:hypothetical protein
VAGYAKLWSGITKSSLWSADLAVRVLFVSMMAEADSTGFVEASLPGLARMAALTREETEAALTVLMAPDPDSKSSEAGGRRVVKVDMGYSLVNYEVYRERQDDAAKREKNRLYMREYRTGKAENLTATDGCKVSVRACKSPSSKVAQAEAEAEAEEKKKETPPARGLGFDFEAIYQAYPGAKGKTKGIEALAKQVTTRATYDLVLASARQYADEERAFKASGSKEFRPAVPNFSTWANQRRWEDGKQSLLLTAPKSHAQILAEESKRQRLAEFEGQP